MKLTVIGGGGVRSMFLAKSIAQKAKELKIDTLVFMDNNEKKLSIYGKMAERVAKIICPEIDFHLTVNPKQAVENADYVITTIRVGEDEMRVKDERIALDMNILGQETTGAAGFSFAMRSVSALKEYCELVKKYAKPGCKVFNFTNPAGLVSQALRDMGYDFTYGICDAPGGMLVSFEKLYGLKEGSLSAEVYGLNHLSFFSSIKLGDREIIEDIINNAETYEKTDLRYFDKDFLKRKGFIPNEYLYYFYNREKAVENIIASGKTRGEQICEINRLMTEQLEKTDIDNDFHKALEIFEHWYGIRENNYMASETGVKRKAPWKFDLASRDSGGYAGVALKFIETAQKDSNGTMILCVENGDALDFLEKSDVVEITCDISKDGATPHKFHDTDELNRELIRRVKLYERLGSRAIIQKSRDLAVDALAVHPLVNSYSLAEKLTDRYIDLNKDYIGEWK